MIHLYTGEGKGKTTAAIGLAMRCLGHGKKVIFSQFMKGNDTGELHSLVQIQGLEILRSEKDFGFYRTMSEEAKQHLTEIHNHMLDSLIEIAKSGNCDMIVLDEITYPVTWGLLDTTKLKTLLAYNQVELVLTGRNPEAFLVELADYHTIMQCEKHPFDKGILAREGIEF